MTDRPPFPRPVELPDPDESGTGDERPFESAPDDTIGTAPQPDPEPVAVRTETLQPEKGVADGVDYALDPNWKTARRISSLIFHAIFWSVLFVTLLIVAFAGSPPQNVKMLAFVAWFALAALFILRAILWPSLAYKYISYRVTDRLFRFRRGVLWRSVISVPRSRVQHTDVSQGPLQRSFGIATLIVHTAGTENASVSLGGLPHEKALKIRDHLIEGEGEGGEGDAV